MAGVMLFIGALYTVTSGLPKQDSKQEDTWQWQWCLESAAPLLCDEDFLTV